MKLEEIYSIAESRSIDPGILSKNELIKSIQTKEGNFDCFGTAYDGVCDQADCRWREDCFEATNTNKGELS
jgi:hypothetical protein